MIDNNSYLNTCVAVIIEFHEDRSRNRRNSTDSSTSNVPFLFLLCYISLFSNILMMNLIIKSQWRSLITSAGMKDDPLRRSFRSDAKMKGKLNETGPPSCATHVTEKKFSTHLYTNVTRRKKKFFNFDRSSIESAGDDDDGDDLSFSFCIWFQ